MLSSPSQKLNREGNAANVDFRHPECRSRKHFVCACVLRRVHGTHRCKHTHTPHTYTSLHVHWTQRAAQFWTQSRTQPCFSVCFSRTHGDEGTQQPNHVNGGECSTRGRLQSSDRNCWLKWLKTIVWKAGFNFWLKGTGFWTQIRSRTIQTGNTQEVSRVPNNSAVGAPSDKGADTAQSVTEHCNHLPALNNKKTFPQLTAKKNLLCSFSDFQTDFRWPLAYLKAGLARLFPIQYLVNTGFIAHWWIYYPVMSFLKLLKICE